MHVNYISKRKKIIYKKNGKICSSSPYGKKGKGGPLEGCLQEPRLTTPPEGENLGQHPSPPPPSGSFTVSVLLWDGNLQSLLRQLRLEERVPTPGGLGSGGKG